MDSRPIVGSASEADLPGISTALHANKSDPSLFQRSEADIRKHLADFLVVRNETGAVIGCAALHRHSQDLAEILSVAVLPVVQGTGVGTRLVEECLIRAEQEGLKTVWLATRKPQYFCRFGFRPISRWSLPSLVLLDKLGQVFCQAPRFWYPSLRGAQIFMERRTPLDS
jgi:amino-acid N-acetyltransferase